MTYPLKTSLAVMRYTLAAFLSVWVLDKFLQPDRTADIWSYFYMVDNLPAFGSYAVGTIQAIALVAFILGVFKFLSYGFWMISHGLGTLLSYNIILDPYTDQNILFWAAFPVLGAFIALFLLREEDTLFTLGKSSALR
ncbi:MAG: hypothetical protein AAF603_10885 [Pseudomonadota bacterium]